MIDRKEMAATTKKLRAKLGTDDDETGFFIELPFDVRKVFGRARPPVRVTVAGYSYRTTVFVYGGRSYVPVRRSHRQAAGVRAGDVVPASIALDTAPRVVRTPPDLAAAMRKNPRVAAAWRSLSYSHKKEHADAIREAKRPETRARRVRGAIAMLAARAPR